MIKVIKDVKTVDKAIKEGFQLAYPPGYSFIENSELVFGAGFKLLKGFYQSRHYYNVMDEYLRITFMIDPRLADSVSNIHDEYVEVSIMVESV